MMKGCSFRTAFHFFFLVFFEICFFIKTFIQYLLNIKMEEVTMLNISLWDSYIKKGVSVVICSRTIEKNPPMRLGYITWTNQKLANPMFLVEGKASPYAKPIRETFHYSDIYDFYRINTKNIHFLVLVFTSCKDIDKEDVIQYLQKIWKIECS